MLISCPECQKEVSSLAVACPHCGVALSRGSAPLPAAPLGVGVTAEETLWEGRPSAALLVGRMVRTALAVLVVPALAYLGYSSLITHIGDMPLAPRTFVQSNRALIAYILGAVVCLILLPSVAGLLSTLVRIKSFRYKLTNQRLLIEKGVLAKTLEEIDMRYVDETQFSQGLLERLSGIGEVRVVSSDKLAPNLQLVGVRDPRGVRELIRSNAYQASQRQFFTRST